MYCNTGIQCGLKGTEKLTALNFQIENLLSQV